MRRTVVPLVCTRNPVVTSARHGLVWYEFDMSWIQILILKFFGLVKSVHVATVTSARAERDAA